MSGPQDHPKRRAFVERLAGLPEGSRAAIFAGLDQALAAKCEAEAKMRDWQSEAAGLGEQLREAQAERDAYASQLAAVAEAASTEPMYAALRAERDAAQAEVEEHREREALAAKLSGYQPTMSCCRCAVDHLTHTIIRERDELHRQLEAAEHERQLLRAAVEVALADWDEHGTKGVGNTFASLRAALAAAAVSPQPETGVDVPQPSEYHRDGSPRTAECGPPGTQYHYHEFRIEARPGPVTATPPRVCENGCGCRYGTTDPDQRDCACDGPCSMADPAEWGCNPALGGCGGDCPTCPQPETAGDVPRHRPAGDPMTGPTFCVVCKQPWQWSETARIEGCSTVIGAAVDVPQPTPGGEHEHKFAETPDRCDKSLFADYPCTVEGCTAVWRDSIHGAGVVDRPGPGPVTAPPDDADDREWQATRDDAYRAAYCAGCQRTASCRTGTCAASGPVV